ncbi:MAG: LptF/LptG family permease [Fimbriimonadaceae bacterium]|nr:LptF/LptG family permease [Fimbriimonadaceae bacterium]
MKKLDQYILREMLVPFITGTFVVVLMFQINAYMYMAKTYNLENVPFSAVVQYILFRTPEYLKMTLVVGTSLGASLAMTRLARESEITAMRAAGVRILRIVFPLFLFGNLVTLANYFLSEALVPDWTKRANAVLVQSGIMGLSKPTMKANAIIELDQYTASFGTVRRLGEYQVELSNVVLLEHIGAQKVSVLISPTGRYDRGVWRFSNATRYEFDGPDLLVMESKEIVINQKIVIDSFLGGSGQNAERSIAELQEAIDSARKIGSDPRRDEIELQSRYSVPVACAVFSLVSPVFALLFARSGGFIGVLVSFVVVLLYYNAFVISTEILGRYPAVPVWVAAWGPDLLFAIAAVIALRKLE